MMYRSTIAAFVALLIAASGAAQPTPAAAKPDPETKKKLKDLETAVRDRKGAQDAKATQIIDELLQKFDAMHPKDQKDFVKELGDVLASTKVKRKPTEDKIYRTTIVALGRTGSEGAGQLAKAFKNKAKFKDKEWINLRGEMLEHIGRTKDPAHVGFLLDVALKDPNDSLMAKAGGALQYYEELKLKQRQDIVKELIRKFSQIHDNANRNLDPGDLVVKAWKDRLTAVSDPWNTTLQKLTKQHLRSANEWRDFYNKHKGDNWDKPLKKTR